MIRCQLSAPLRTSTSRVTTLPPTPLYAWAPPRIGMAAVGQLRSRVYQRQGMAVRRRRATCTHTSPGVWRVVWCLALCATAVRGADDEWSYSFHCSTITVNNDTAISDRCDGNVCGTARLWKEPRLFSDGSGIVYVRADSIGVGGSCPSFLSGASCATSGAFAKTCSGTPWLLRCPPRMLRVCPLLRHSSEHSRLFLAAAVHSCQLSTWSDWYQCNKACGVGQQPRNQTFAFTIVVSQGGSVVTVGKPCMEVEELKPCELRECEGPSPVAQCVDMSLCSWA